MSAFDLLDEVLDEEGQLLDPPSDEGEEDAATETASKPYLDYITSMAFKHAPSSQQEYLQRGNHTWLLPNPILVQQRAAAAGDAELASKPLDPTALRCAGVSVTEVSWHWDMLLTAFWRQHKCGGSQTGQPPCPHCYGARSQEQQEEGQQEPGAAAAAAAEIRQWDKDKCGTVTSHGWSKPVQRYLTLAGQEGYMLVQQYRCRGCPGG